MTEEPDNNLNTTGYNFFDAVNVPLIAFKQVYWATDLSVEVRLWSGETLLQTENSTPEKAELKTIFRTALKFSPALFTPTLRNLAGHCINYQNIFEYIM